MFTDTESENGDEGEDADDEADEAEEALGAFGLAEGGVGQHAFSKMEENPDVLRKNMIMNKERARQMSNMRRLVTRPDWLVCC